MNFKTFFTEAGPIKKRTSSLEGYTVPTSLQTKFKEGDIVVVHIPSNSSYVSSDAYFRVYHPKYALPYKDEVGIVNLYKNFGQSVKYGIEFEDGNVIPIQSSFLIGPFASKEKAEKYKARHGQDVQSNINVEDLAGFEPTGTVEVNAEIEDAFKQRFVTSEIGFVWLDNPLIIKYKNFDAYVLAIKRNKYTANASSVDFVNEPNRYDRLNNPKRPEFDNCFVFCKVIDKLTKKLKKTQVLSSKGSGSGCYFIQTPTISRYFDEDTFKDGKIVNWTKIFDIKMQPVRGFQQKAQSNYIKQFITYDDSNSLKTGFDIFKGLYGIEEGDTVITPSSNFGNLVRIDESMLGDDFNEISNFSINGDCSVVFEQKNNVNITALPQHVSGKLYIDGPSTISSLEGLDKCKCNKVNISGVVETLEGFPEHLNTQNSSFTFNSAVKSLKGIPDVFYGTLSFSRLNSYVGAANCINKGQITVRDSTRDLTGFFKDMGTFTAWNLKDEQIAEYLKYRDLENKHPELEGIFS